MKTYTTVSGTFIQPWAFAKYSVAQWEEHYDKLLEVGIDTVILQWSATTPYGRFKDCFYRTILDLEKHTDDYRCFSACIPNMLAAAKNKRVKVWLGLNISDEWWRFSTLSEEWSRCQAQIGVAIAKELYDNYYADYSESFAGWYWPWELYNHMSLELALTGGEFMDMYLDGLTDIDPALPLMLSPFISDRTSLEHTESVWNKFFESCNMRSGDIFCCQDSVGAGHLPIEKLDSYCKAIYNSIRKQKGIVFLANNENFNPNFTSAELSRFVEQMKITDKYVTGHVTFSYSHYYHPDRHPDKHLQYKKYFETGEVS